MNKPEIGIAVDASIVGGNPGGQMEIRGIDLLSAEEVFREIIGPGTNNIGEFLAIFEGIRAGRYTVIWTDSRVAKIWIENRKCNTRYEMDEPLLTRVRWAEEWLEEVDYKNKVRFWDNKKWGEIPADFQRK